MSIGVGLLGLGIMGRRMLVALSAHEGFRIAAGWDPSGTARDGFATDHPGARVARDAADLIADPSVEVVYIATPPKHHMPLANAVFDAGKAAFCEKPLGVTDAECAEAVARIEREGLRAAVNFSQTQSPAALEIGRLLKGEALGPLRDLRIEASFAAWPRSWQVGAASWLADREEGGFVREVFSHFLFMARRQLGELVLDGAEVDYPARGSETSMRARLTAGGIPVTLDGAVRGTIDDTNSWTLTGDRGALRVVDWIRLERREGEGDWSPVDLGPADTLRPRAMRAQLDSIAALASGRPSTAPTFAEALDVQRTVEAILAAG